MAYGKNDRKTSKLAKIAIILVVLLIASMLGIDIPSMIDIFATEPVNPQSTTETTAQSVVQTNPQGTLIVTMIDVGQGDSFLLEQNGTYGLIDCGTSSGGKAVVEYLQEKGITKLQYVFGTHPHDDHEGGMAYVIQNVNVGKIILPQIKEEHAQTTWYKKLIKVIKDGGYKLEYVELGNVYTLGKAQIKVIGPISDPKDDKNNYSTVLKVSFGENDIIFTGDAEVPVERDILKSGQDVDAEILKVGHHGSDTSSSEEWLDAISPEYALISCELDNKHEHPIKEIMQRLEERDIIVYRTDECGTVVVTITATDITFSCPPGDYLSGIELAEREGVK